MKYNEENIKSFQWKVDHTKKKTTSEVSISNLEQESHYNVSEFDGCIYVCASDRKTITRLKKHPEFTLTDVLLNRFGRIIQVSGTLPLWCLSLRYKRRSNSRYEDTNENEDGVKQ